MNRQELKERTKRFALQVIHFIENLPKSKIIKCSCNTIIKVCYSNWSLIIEPLVKHNHFLILFQKLA